MTNIRVFDEKSSLCKELGESILAIERSKETDFVVAFSGGSLPELVAAALKDSDVQWEKWRVLFADERYVAEGHSDRNQTAFMTHVGAVAGGRLRPDQVLGIRADLSLDECARDYQSRLPAAIDLVLLGMGPDGHTCSLFPGHALNAEAARRVAPISDSPKPPPERVTLTWPALDAASHIFYVVTGASKAPAVKRALASDPSIPAGHVFPSPPTWFLDSEAFPR